MQGCAGMLQHGDPISCAVNPEVGREARPLRDPVQRRDILVVGAGPAGMEAARRAAELGHRVSLVERSDRLGGQLRWAATTPALAHFSRLLAWYERSLTELDVEIRLGTDGEDAGSEPAIVATGCDTEIPALAGFDRVAAWTLPGYFDGEPATTGEARPSGHVVIAGGGQRSLAAALKLATESDRVTLVADRFGADTSGLTRRAFLARCDAAGIERRRGRITAIGETGVILDDDSTLDADGLVLAEPLRPHRPLSGGVRIGDAAAPGGIAEAIASGRQAAEAL